MHLIRGNYVYYPRYCQEKGQCLFYSTCESYSEKLQNSCENCFHKNSKRRLQMKNYNILKVEMFKTHILLLHYEQT